MTLVTFIIPVRHPENSPDWGRLKANLVQTIASISAQTRTDWRALIVANIGADLPDLPAGFEVATVSFPPNNLHNLTAGGSSTSFYDAFRLDKGRRVLTGMLLARDSRYFMIVDDDDFVSSRIVEHVAIHEGESGWKVEHGFVWGDGGTLLYQHDNFSDFCGTSLIIRSDLYNLPEQFEHASHDYICTYLGSHLRIGNVLADAGTPLVKLPFRGAIYRVGHAGAHSNSPKLLQMYFLNRDVVRRPRSLLRNLTKLRWLTPTLRREFFGGDDTRGAVVS